MSVAAEIAVHGGRGSRPLPRASVAHAYRPGLRLVTFSALALYGVLRWAMLESPAPGARLAGLLALALLVAGVGPWLDARSRPLAIAGVALALLGMLAVAGIPVAWLVHARMAVIAGGVGSGISALPGVLLPYLGLDQWVQTIMALGAGVLLLDSAILIAFAPRTLGDLRRGAAALPLIALAVIPSTLMRPQLPYVQGLILFVLVAAFMWGERVARGRAAGAVAFSVLAGVTAAFIAPGIEQSHAWINPQHLAGSLTTAKMERFDWTQRYGPFNWPRHNRTVLYVRATRPDYWKAQNLESFNGFGWGPGPRPIGPRPPAPTRTELARFSQTIQVTLRSMTTTDVIAGGYSSRPEHVDKQLAPGRSPGTWVGGTALASGESYTVRTYSPSPSPTELATDRGPYPGPALASELTIELPTNAGPHAIRFPTFHSGERPDGIAVIDHSPYARAYALAVQLAERTATPYGFALAIERFLSQANGFAYDENPPQSAFPLETFLFAARRGYCQHFAGAMALLLRMGGVPARVATGFTTGDYDSAARKYVVSDLDAHAWVEVWFPRYGWVRFDPTPGGAPARGGSSALLPGLSGRLPIGLAPKPGSRSPTGHTTGAGRVSARPHGGGLPLTWLAVGTVLAIAVVALLGWWALRPVTAEQLVAELEQAIARVALAPRGITLRALERRFSGSTGAECYVRRLRLARFSDGQELPGPAERRALRNQIASGRGLAGRLRAWWALPPRVLH